MTADAWWERHRIRCNVGLVAAGALAFAAYVTVVTHAESIGTLHDADVTLFTTAFQGFGYLVMMLVANVCYGLGPWSESIVRPANVERYRRVTYSLGFWFPILLPFSIPALDAWYYLLHPAVAATAIR